MNIRLSAISILALAALLSQAVPADEQSVRDHGRYLVKLGGCNDCHTPGYAEAAGNLPQSQWLVGSAVGFRGPWGTSYPVNLRLFVQNLSEQAWLEQVRQPMRPPMPWFALRDMTDADLIAIYRFIRGLGPAGEPAPVAVAPGEPVNTAFIEFTPKRLPRQAQVTKP
jgi:mono/diheme cytochrome c family protein